MNKTSSKRIAINAILNSLKTVLGIIFPLLTFQYVNRVLGAEKLGLYNFSVSVVSYFLLIAALGISAYGVREGTQYRDNKSDIERFVSEIFSINLIATAISYILLLVILVLIPKFHNYYISILILSVVIISTTLGVAWVCNIFEDFLFITIRSLLVQLISLALTFNKIYKHNILKRIGIVGSNASIGKGCMIIGGLNMTIGKLFSAGDNLNLQTWEQYRGKPTGFKPSLRIGDNVSFMSNCHIMHE